VGRAGRDGAHAFGLLLYTPKNAKVRKDMINAGKRTADRVLALWSGVIASGRSEVRSLNPNMEFQGKDAEYALFHAFQRAGALEVLARGPSRLTSFAARGVEGKEFLDRMGAATRTGNFLAAFRKLKLDPGSGYQRLFELYNRGAIQLVRSPDNVMVFRSKQLSAEQAQGIANDVNKKVAKRLADFEAFKTLIETSDDPDLALRSRFGS
jgi:hypothetical protein